MDLSILFDYIDGTVEAMGPRHYNYGISISRNIGDTRFVLPSMGGRTNAFNQLVAPTSDTSLIIEPVLSTAEDFIYLASLPAKRARIEDAGLISSEIPEFVRGRNNRAHKVLLRDEYGAYGNNKHQTVLYDSGPAVVDVDNALDTGATVRYIAPKYDNDYGMPTLEEFVAKRDGWQKVITPAIDVAVDRQQDENNESVELSDERTNTGHIVGSPNAENASETTLLENSQTPQIIVNETESSGDVATKTKPIIQYSPFSLSAESSDAEDFPMSPLPNQSFEQSEPIPPPPIPPPIPTAEQLQPSPPPPPPPPMPTAEQLQASSLSPPPPPPLPTSEPPRLSVSPPPKRYTKTKSTPKPQPQFSQDEMQLELQRKIEMRQKRLEAASIADDTSSVINNEQLGAGGGGGVVDDDSGGGAAAESQTSYPGIAGILAGRMAEMEEPRFTDQLNRRRTAVYGGEDTAESAESSTEWDH